MAKNILPTQGARVLKATSFDYAMPINTVAQRAGIPTHAVHYWLGQLKERGIIRRGVVLDSFRAGQMRYGFYFSIHPSGLKNKERLLKVLSSNQNCIWYGELGAEFQFGITFVCENPGQLEQFLSSLEQKISIRFIKKLLTIQTRFVIQEKTYLWGSNTANRQVLSVNIDSKPTILDDVDQSILKVMGNSSSNLDIMRKTSIPRQTIDLRIKRLKSEGIIAKEIYYISAVALGYQVFRVLVTFEGKRELALKKFEQFCCNEPHVTNYAMCIGQWDAEIGLEASSTAQIRSAIQRLSDILGDALSDASVMPVLQQGTYKELQLQMN